MYYPPPTGSRSWIALQDTISTTPILANKLECSRVIADIGTKKYWLQAFIRWTSRLIGLGRRSSH